MMSSVIRQETAVFLLAVGHGAGLTLCYDILRALRRAFRHNLAAVSAEDFLFWLAAGFFTFVFIFLETDGVPRGYVAAGILLGAVFYHFALSEYLVGGLSGVLKGIRYVCAQVGRVLRRLSGGVRRRMRRIWRSVSGPVKRALAGICVPAARRLRSFLAAGKILKKRPGRLKRRRQKKRRNIEEKDCKRPKKRVQ